MPEEDQRRHDWYLHEMERVVGKPKMVSERYVGTAAEIEAMLGQHEAAMMPERTRHLEFGGVAAAWGMITDLGVIAMIDAAAGPRPSGQPLSAGTYLALAALNRLIAPSRGSRTGGGRRRRTGSPGSPPHHWITGGSGT